MQKGRSYYVLWACEGGSGLEQSWPSWGKIWGIVDSVGGRVPQIVAHNVQCSVPCLVKLWRRAWRTQIMAQLREARPLIVLHPLPSYHTILYHIISYHIISYHIIPYRTIPYYTIPYHALPYHTIPYNKISPHHHTQPSTCVCFSQD